METNKNHWGLDVGGIDTSIDPANDFFQYVNGRWMRETQIPEDQVAWGSFFALAHQNICRIKEILDAISRNEEAPHDRGTQKLRDLYATAMDMEKRDRDRVAHLGEQLEAISRITGTEDIAKVCAMLHGIDANPLFTFYTDSDPRESGITALVFSQSGLGLPDREYYLEADKEGTRQQYAAHMQQMFRLLGDDSAAAEHAATSILKIETELAEASWESWRLRDIEAQCNYFSPGGLQDLCPSIRWDDYFRVFDIETPKSIIVSQPSFLVKVNELIVRVPLDAWKSYFRWKLIAAAAPYLSEDFIKERFNFVGKVLYGQKQMKPLWERSVREVNELVGEMVGRQYVARYFPPEAKEKIQELVQYIVATFKNRLERLAWMEETTKREALKKLDAITWKLGYPDLWRDYTMLEIGTDAYVRTVMRIVAFEMKRRFAKIGKEIEKREWRHMAPQTVNACADQGLVEMMFPAGILQWPFFDPDADDAINFGAIGAVIGHELIHHFDDQGSKFNAEGKLKSWWTKEDRITFEKLAHGLVTQFDQYQILGRTVNGKLTLGENIADLGGLHLAFEAYQNLLRDKGTRVSRDGFTPEQRFFIGFAQAERYKMRDELQMQALIADPHPPAQFRINGPLSHTAEFYEAFGVREGNTLYRKPEDRIVIW